MLALVFFGEEISEKREARSKKQEARSKKQETRSEKQETRIKSIENRGYEKNSIVWVVIDFNFRV